MTDPTPADPVLQAAALALRSEFSGRREPTWIGLAEVAMRAARDAIATQIEAAAQSETERLVVDSDADQGWMDGYRDATESAARIARGDTSRATRSTSRTSHDCLG